MKKRLSVVVLLCFLFSLLCGCTAKTPQFLPGEQEGDENYVWVCKEPFAYFSLNTPTEEIPAKFKLYLEKNEKIHFFYGDYTLRSGALGFVREDYFNGADETAALGGTAEFYESYFDLVLVHDFINFFDGEFPTLRFEKMTKEEFKKEYGEVKNITVFD